MSEEKKEHKLRTIFLTMLSISATTNGGFAIMAVMKQRFVSRYGWLKEEELLDLTSIAQSVPGPIAVNAAVLAGHRMAGAAGSLAAVGGTVLPPLFIMTLVTVFYRLISGNFWVECFMKGMQAGVAALLLSVTLDLILALLKKKQRFGLALAAAVFALCLFVKVNKFLLAACCAAAGILWTLLLRRKAKEKEDGDAS